MELYFRVGLMARYSGADVSTVTRIFFFPSFLHVYVNQDLVEKAVSRSRRTRRRGRCTHRIRSAVMCCSRRC
jgi:hypothetical protein